jgi:IS5 family transposase
MLIVGCCFGIRSERRLCEEVHLNLAYRWFCRLGLDGDVPDHSTFSKNRHGRFRDSDVLRHVFEIVVRRCMAKGLVGGEGFAIDASLIKADANRQSGVQGTEGLDPVRSSVRFVSIWRCWTTRPSARRRPARRSILRRSIRPRGGLRQTAAWRSSPMQPILIDLDHSAIVEVEASSAYAIFGRSRVFN